MPKRINLSQQRVEISRLAISMLRLSWVYSDSISDGLICAAIYIGQFEGRPMTAAHIASHVGISRPTVIRRLAVLVEAGRVLKPNGSFELPLDAINTPEITQMVMETEKLIHRTAAILSKLDTFGIAKR